MFTKLPDCARCGEDELWLVPGAAGIVQVKCYWCGWSSGPIESRDGMTKAELIAAAVREYKAAVVEDK